MHELRLVAVSEDGTYLVLASAGRGTRFMLPVDDRLRAAVRGQFSRLGQYEIEVENPLRPKEIQARIRSGETAEAISEISGIPIERVRWFEGPVLQEREYIAQQAQRASVRAHGDAAPGPSLEELVAKRIGAHQLETGDAVWDSWKREDRSWQIKLVFLHGGEERVAHWLYEPRHNSVAPADEEAAWFSSAETEPAPSPGANVTPFAPRRAEAPAEPLRPDPRPVPTPEPRADHASSGRPSSDTPQDEPLRPAPAVRPDPWGGPAAPPAERRPAVSERTRPAEPPAEHRRPETAQRRPRPEPERRPGPAAGGEAAERVRRPERRQVDWPVEARPARPAEPEPAPPAAEVPPRPAPRRRRATIDLNESGTPRRAVDQTPAVPTAANAGPDRPAAPKRKGRGRRASVPSWDEIMFGSKKEE
ncbi:MULTISPECIES: septation protein SepH [unclassified Nocardiopsis]|uniref:septation protein SepH n=2 Tax=Nocardiopsis TaxID=2013 RepID=UPI00135CB46D|nr:MULTISPECIES: septation protein SepH [unclassified Nocardiopsis]